MKHDYVLSLVGMKQGGGVWFSTWSNAKVFCVPFQLVLTNYISLPPLVLILTASAHSCFFSAWLKQLRGPQYHNSTARAQTVSTSLLPTIPFFPRAAACTPLGFWQLVSFLSTAPLSAEPHLADFPSLFLILHRALLDTCPPAAGLPDTPAFRGWCQLLGFQGPQPWTFSQGQVGQAAGGAAGQVWRKIGLTEEG